MEIKFSGDTIFVNTTDAIVKKELKARGLNEFPPILTNETIEGGRTKNSLYQRIRSQWIYS